MARELPRTLLSLSPGQQLGLSKDDYEVIVIDNGSSPPLDAHGFQALNMHLTLLTMPLTYSIAHGIGCGFITYVVIKLLTGRWREAHPLMIGAAALFAAYFALESVR